MRHLILYLFRIVIITVFALSTNSCVLVESPIMEGGGDAYIKTEIVTYSLASEDPYTLGPAEYVIRRFRLYAFDGDKLDNMVYFDNLTTDNLGEYVATMKVSQTSNKKLYCIVNEPDNAEMHSRLALINNPDAFSQVEYEIADYVTSGYNSDAAFVKSKFCLPAFGETAEFSTITATPETPISVNLKTTRSLARVDVMVQKLSTVTENVTFNYATKLSIINTRAKGFISPAQTPSGSLITSSVNSSTSLIVPVRHTSNYQRNAIRAFTFYTPERTCAGDTEKLKLVLENVKFGPSLRSYALILDNETEPKLTKIERNRVYRLYCTFTPQSAIANLNILDWEEEIIDGSIYGTEFTVSDDVVAIPVANGVGSSKTLNLTASENITFIEYEYLGTKGDASVLPAGLTFTGIDAINGTAKTGSVTCTSSSTSTAINKVYLWFKAGNITKRVAVEARPFVFEPVAPTSSFPWNGGQKDMTVLSYVSSSNMPVAWTASEFSLDGGATWTDRPPYIVPTFTESGVGGNYPTSYPVKMLISQGHNTHNDMLKATSPISGTYNLSNSTGAASVQNTANCYIVNAPGNYSLPLVYGNAIKNSATNASAYSTTVSGTDVLQQFIKHDGTAITSPYITGATNAVLVWQDVPNLLTNVALTGGKLTFTVNQATIAQGNAVVAVRNASNEVLWSWHIWVTDYIPYTTKFTNDKDVVYNFMSVYLGWCDPIVFDARTIMVRFTQAESGIQKIITLTQNAGTTLGDNTYYQFGRKDAIVGAFANAIDKPMFDASNNLLSITAASPVSTVENDIIAESILHPEICYASLANRYINLWSADNNCDAIALASNDAPVVKTVYDPSPVGYHLPASRALWSLLLIKGTHSGNTMTYSKPGCDDLCFYMTGNRDMYNGFVCHNYSVFYILWSAVATSPSYCIGFTGSTKELTNMSFPRSYTVSVRCVKE